MASITEFSRLSAILTLNIAGFLRNSEIAQRQLTKIGTVASQAGAALTRGFGLAFGLVGAGSVKAAAEFNKLSVQLRSLVQDGSFDALTKQARQLGENTIFTTIQIREAQKELAKLGTQGFDIAPIVESVAGLAGALDEDLGDSAAAVKESLNIFQLGADQSTRVVDLFAKAVSTSALTIPQLREGLKNIGPIAQQQNLSIEQTVALLALLANSAIKGSVAGTKLRSTLNKMAKNGFDDANDSLKVLSETTFSYSDLLGLLNSRSVVVGALLQEQGDDLQALTRQYENATGTAAELSGAFEGELFFTVEQLRNAVQSLAISIGNSLKPTMETLRDIAEGLARAFATLEGPQQKALGAFITLVPAVAAGVFVFGQLAIALSAIATPIGLVVAGLSLFAIGAIKSVVEARQLQFEIQQLKDQADAIASDTSDRTVEGTTTDDLPQVKKQIADLNKIFDDAAGKIANANGRINELQAKLRDLTGEGQSPLKQIEQGFANLFDPLAVERTKREIEDVRAELALYEAELGDIEEEHAGTLANLKDQEATLQRQLSIEQAKERFIKGRRKINAEIRNDERLSEEAAEKVAKLNARANKLLKDRAVDLLPEAAQEAAKINNQFDGFVDQMIELGGSTANLERVRDAILDIAEELTAREVQKGIADLTTRLNSVGDSDLQSTIRAINTEMAQLATEFKDNEEALSLIERIANAERAEAFEEYFKDTAEAAQKAIDDRVAYTTSGLALELYELDRAKQEMLKGVEKGSQAELEILNAYEAKKAALRKEFAEDEQKGALEQLMLVRDFVNTLGNTFGNALSQGTNFFQALGDAFLSFFSRVIGKLIALITLYGILAILSGGGTATTGIGGIASTAMGTGGLGSFISTGLGFSTRSATGGGGFRLDGRDLVLSTNRTERANTRIL